MARKKTSASSTKKTTKTRKTAPRSTKAAPKKTPQTRAKTPAKSRGAASAARSNRRSIPKPPPILSGMTLDRKLDLTGVLLAFIGLLTVLALLSSSRSQLTEGWVRIWRSAFGWGVYLLPIGLILIGLWLILRNFERVPTLAVERLVGVFLLFVNILTLLHFLLFPVDAEAGFSLAAAGSGGGYTGAFLNNLLVSGFGLAGTGIALFAWMLIGLVLMLDVTIADLFGWAPPFMAAV
jgi:S-DNA-T family DNA segregation ATPase FtsK/SpoIIIE